MKISHPIDLALSQIASVMIVTIIAAAATNGLNSHQLAAGEPGWRSGASVWNGNGYDLPNAQEEALPTKIVAEEPPYVVPSEPGGARTNPYFESNTGSNSSPVEVSRTIDSPGESLSDLVESLTDPYEQSITP